MKYLLIVCLAVGVYAINNLYVAVIETRAWAYSDVMAAPPHLEYIDVMEILHGCVPSVFPSYRGLKSTGLTQRNGMSYKNSNGVFVIKEKNEDGYNVAWAEHKDHDAVALK